MLSTRRAARGPWPGHFAALLMAAAGLAACASMPPAEATSGPRPAAVASALASAQPGQRPSPEPASRPTVQALIPASSPATIPPILPATAGPPGLGPLTSPGFDLRAGPVAVPLELRIPALGVSAPVLGVGITAQNAMDAPKGPIGDAVWQTAFWYRGSSVPGDSGTATMAGHVDDPLGRPAIFARLQDLRPGDLIVVHAASGLDLRFVVTQNETYSAQQSADPAVLAQIYGAGPVSGQGPQPAPDGRSHLTLITCTGSIVNGAFDHHVVVYAMRSP